LYDLAGRLASVRQEQTSTGNLIVEHSYQYDALDRIEQETGTPEPTPFTVPIALMTYDADDRLDTFNGLQCMSDLDGNLVTGPLNGNLTGFTFDARNRLVEVGNATFGYDADGRRVSKTENGTATSYVHDPQASLSRMLTATTSNSTTFYVYAPGGMLLYEDGPAGLRVPHHDYRGSTVALSNATGAVIGRVVYGTYGEVASRTGDTDTRFLYHGAYGVETDANGLCLMRARYYSPETRRFLNADPIGFGGGANWYGYLATEPVNSIDPLGLDIIEIKRKANLPLGIASHYYIIIGTGTTTVVNADSDSDMKVGNAVPISIDEYVKWAAAKDDTVKVVKRIKTTEEEDKKLIRLLGIVAEKYEYTTIVDDCGETVDWAVILLEQIRKRKQELDAKAKADGQGSKSHK